MARGEHLDPDYYKNYYAANRDSRLAKSVAWYESNKPRKQATDKALRDGPRRDELLDKKRAAYVRDREYHRIKSRDFQLKKHYGITYAQKLSMIDAQGGDCASCLRPLPTDTRHIHVDHNHASGRVRGILCHNCNKAIGFANDDPALLRLAADYLERHAA